MKNLILLVLASLMFVACSGNQSAGEQKPEWKAKHVILIGIDGWGAYSMDKAKVPNIRFLMDSGAYTLKKRSVLPSSSAVNWASMYMGAGPELHGYCEWGSKVPDLPSRVVNKNGIFPTIFSELRAIAPEAEIGNICEWEGIRYLVDTLALNYDKHVMEVSKDSTATARFAVNYIREKKPVLVNIVFDALDHVGHAAIMQAVKDAGIWEESVLIVTADHGGIEKGHGGRTMQEMETPFIIYGKNIKKGAVIEESMMQFDIASTIASIFGIQQPQVWIGRPMPVFR